MASISVIEGIGPNYAAKLKEVGIRTCEKLLDAGGQAADRKHLSRKTGISDNQILRWVNHADLCRIKGIGGQYAEILEAIGVDTVRELSRRRPEYLCRQMAELNDEKNLVRKLPTEEQLREWVRVARNLPRAVSH